MGFKVKFINMVVIGKNNLDVVFINMFIFGLFEVNFIMDFIQVFNKY